MLFAIFFRIVVLPAFGGATIIPLCPLPMGAIISIILIAISMWAVSNFILLSG